MFSISEPDWKLFRRLQPIALDRFSQKVLAEGDRIASDTDKTHHERYLAVYKHIQQRDKELTRALDDLHRTTAIQQLAYIQSHALLTTEEMAEFSVEIRSAVGVLLGANENQT